MAKPKPLRRVARGAVVDIVSSRDGRKQGRGIVMAIAPSDNYSRAYGRQFIVCELYGDAAHATTVATDAIKVGRISDAKKIIENATTIHETNLLRPVGRVKKIPKICRLALKAERGKL